MDDIIELNTTVSNREQAESLAKQIVEARLGACVQLTGPIQSVYRWQEQLCCETEFRCTVKTTRALAERLTAFVQQQHPYDVPEILISSIADASPEYAQWLRAQVT